MIIVAHSIPPTFHDIKNFARSSFTRYHAGRQTAVGGGIFPERLHWWWQRWPCAQQPQQGVYSAPLYIVLHVHTTCRTQETQ